ncbi:ABC transporter substrate-binding protein [Neoaquamicrobium sediminum]|uniref:ABC transporter substrate-binding protein n=1 Tax=Neoaquamicrobium sediminum TaxID=1849104 RepID=UPI004035F05F
MNSRIFTAAALALGVSLSANAHAETFRWSATTDPQTMDPHAANLAPVTSFLNNIYEGLVRRAPDMSIEPSLATEWKPLEDEDGWRFVLRQGVEFHDGSDFTADDVLFSYERGISEQSDVRSWFAPVQEVRIVDDYTVDFVTKAPDPIFPESIANWMIMDRDWAAANNSTMPAKDQPTFATLNTNGTGPFKLAARDPDVQTRLAVNEEWWDEPQHNVTEAVFTPIGSAATAIAALVSGEIDMLQSVPVQDAERLRSIDGIKTLEGLEARVIVLGFAHDHPALYGSLETTGKNPFQDVRVRRAVASAINVDAIDRVLMNGMAEPASQLVPAGLSGYSTAHSSRPAYDADAARALLAEAGYPEGFSFSLRCTNDRYLNDDAVCQAITGMLAAVGLKAQLETMPVRTYWTELREDRFDVFLLGWSPGTFDAEHPIRFLVHTPSNTLGTWNFGGYSNARVDELLPMVQQELDAAKRQAMLDEIAGIVQDDMAYVPLYVEPLVWAARDAIDVLQRPDNFFMLRWVQVKR